MKKFCLLAGLMIFLFGVAWGQAEFSWSGAGADNDWNNPNNWTLVNAHGVGTPNYPGESPRIADIVVINTNVWPGDLQFTNNITINNLTIGIGVQVNIDTNTNALTITGKTELNGILIVLPPLAGGTSTSRVNITDLTVAPGSTGFGIAVDSNVRMNGALVSLDPYYDGAPININPVNGNIGNIDAGNRSVTITIDNAVGWPITIGNIVSSKDITINAGTGNDVTIGDITAGGNVTINAGTGSDVDVSDIHAGGTITTPGGGTVILGDEDTFIWLGTTSTNWTVPTNWFGNHLPGDGDPAYTIIIHESTPTRNPVFNGTALTCGTLTIDTGASLDISTYNLSVNTTFTNNGNLIIEGVAGQAVNLGSVTVNETVTFNSAIAANGVNFAGLTSFKNLTVQNGARTGVGAVAVSGEFRLEGGSLNATSINVPAGTSYIAGNITTNATQIYTGTVTFAGTGLLTLTGSTVTLGAFTVSGSPSLAINGDGVLNGGSGINVLSVSGNTTINANINTSGNQSYGAAGTTVLVVGVPRTLASSGGAITAIGAVSGAGVTVEASQGISLANAANALSGTITLNNNQTGTTPAGNITFTNSSTSISLAAENASIGGNITIDKDGSLTITSLKTAGSGSISIDATGAVAQTGAVETNSLTVTTFMAAITLPSANKVTSVSLTNAFGNIEFANENAGGLAVTVSSPGNVTITETAGNISGGSLNGSNITVNASGNITLPSIIGNGINGVILNAGYPNHQVFGTPGTVTLTALTIAADLTIWGENVVSGGGTKNVTGKVDVNTDNVTTAATFLTSFTSTGSTDNKLRPTNTVVTFLYAFTEDSTHNGKIDRIRLQASSALNNIGTVPGNSRDLVIALTDIATNKSYTDAIHEYENSNDPDSIYINLDESKMPYDTGIIFKWEIAVNTIIKDSSGTKQVGIPGANGITTDTAPPRITYALAVPGHNQIYFQVSEPLANWNSLTVTVSSGTVVSVAPINAKEFIINVSANLTVSDLVSGSLTFTVGDIVDNATPAGNVTPLPKYPVNYTYGTYNNTTGIVLPNRGYVFITGANAPVSHRVTDMLISVPPSDATDVRYFVLPVTATNDTGSISDFSGKGSLEKKDITLQSIQNNVLTGMPDIIFAFNVSSEYKSTNSQGSPGLWNPGSSISSINPPFVNLFPDNPPAKTSMSPVAPPSPPRFNYELLENVFQNNTTVEFFYHLNSAPSDLFAGRLDMAAGSVIPGDWYRRIRPFSFSVHDAVQQRGSVSILNNVINSEKRERVYLDYKLKKPGRVTVQVFTLDGNLVKVLVRESQNASDSFYRVSWDGTNNGGRPVARGMYFIRIVAPDIDEIRKVMVIK